jgi:photosystem II P680 reaction center D1 protein
MLMRFVICLTDAHNFPLDLAAAESTPVALTAPTIG